MRRAGGAAKGAPKGAPSAKKTARIASAAPANRAAGQRFRPREVQLPDGARLRLRADGAIWRLDGAGAMTESWGEGDAGWADQALRFGLRPQARTVAPHGGPVPAEKPPR